MFAKHIKVIFFEGLEGSFFDIPLREKVFLLWDLNGHVGNVSRDFERVPVDMVLGM